jgi:two-component system sensor histidine kinase RpfC
VTTATDGEVALNLYVEKQFELDLIILDLNMPNMNGLEVTQFIRMSEQSNKRIPVIILSADATKQAEERAINAGATAFLTKPLRLNALNEKLADICDRFRKENGYVDIPREKTEAPNQSIALDPALKILNLASLEELKTVSDKPEFVKNLIIEYLKDSGDLMSKLEHAIATEDYQLWADTAHAFAGSTDWLGLARLNKLLRVASKLEPQIFTDNGASIFKQIAVEYRSAKQSLQPLY